MLKKEPFTLFLLAVLASIPLLFGARHPLIQGGYSFFLLVCCGGWLMLNSGQLPAGLVNSKTMLIAALLCLILATSFSLPLFSLQILSPVRANFLLKAEKILEVNPTTALSYYAPGTRFHAVYLTALLLCFLCATALLRKDYRLTAALWVIMGVGTIEAVYGLLQAMNPSLGVLWLPSQVGAEGCARGTIIYRNQYAAFLNMCWPMSLALGLTLSRQGNVNSGQGKNAKESLALAQQISQGFKKATLPVLASAFMILAVILSRSRGGIVVMVLIVALLLFLLPSTRRTKGLTGGAFLLFILLYGGMIGLRQVADRFLFFYDSALDRFELWRDSLAILKDHLLTGIGLGSYQFLSPVYLRKVPGNAWYDYAHNEYVELAIELGLPLMLLFLVWICWGLGKHGARIIEVTRQTGALMDIADKDIVAIGAFCGIVGLLLHGFVDFIWRLPVNSFYAVMLLAMLSVATAHEQTDESQ